MYRSVSRLGYIVVAGLVLAGCETGQQQAGAGAIAPDQDRASSYVEPTDCRPVSVVQTDACQVIRHSLCDSKPRQVIREKFDRAGRLSYSESMRTLRVEGTAFYREDRRDRNYACLEIVENPDIFSQGVGASSKIVETCSFSNGVKLENVSTYTVERGTVVDDTPIWVVTGQSIATFSKNGNRSRAELSTTVFVDKKREWFAGSSTTGSYGRGRFGRQFIDVDAKPVEFLEVGDDGFDSLEPKYGCS